MTWIGVDESFRRSNLGLRLYRRVEERFRDDGVRMVLTDTAADNSSAISFFEHEGFSLSGQYSWLAKTLRRPEGKRSKPEGAARVARRRKTLPRAPVSN